MRISLLNVLLLEDGTSHQDLKRIFLTIADGWHDLGDEPSDKLLQSAYFGLHIIDRELAMKSAMSATYLPVVVDALEVSPPGSEPTTQSLPLDLAAAYLMTPLQIFVENAATDSEFHERMLAAVRPEFVALFRQPRPPVRWENGGGKSGISQQIERQMQLARRSRVPPRIFVLADSDARFPGHIDPVSSALIKNCERHGVPYRLTKKRAIENYVWDRCLLQWAEREASVADRVTFLLQLDDETRDHLPIRKGFKRSPSGSLKLSDQEQSLYAKVPVDDWSGLDAAREILDLGHMPTASDLQARGCEAEYIELANQIGSSL